MNADANSNPIHKSLIARTKILDLKNGINSDHALSPTQENLTAKLKIAQVSVINVTTRGSLKTLDVTSNPCSDKGEVTSNRKSSLHEKQTS